VNIVLGPARVQPLVLRRPALTAGSHWRAMPCVWWPWLCQVVFVEVASELIALDLVSLEPARAGGTPVPAGATFSIRERTDPRSRGAELGALAAWTRTGAPVTILAGRHGRSAWVGLSRGHRRVLLTDVTAMALTTG
jgi:hypothetical protein